MRTMKLAPSILAADFTNLDHAIQLMVKGGASYLHFDVMDGHFVDNISFGVPVLKAIKGKYPLINDVHLMISDPLKFIVPFAQSGADIITFHYEALTNDEQRWEVIKAIQTNHVKVGMTVKPKTPVEVLLPFLHTLDLVLIMSVEPGFGGQAFLEDSLDKIKILRKYIDTHHLHTLIEIDGGINAVTAKKAKDAGVDILVAGSYIFNAANPLEQMAGLLHD